MNGEAYVVVGTVAAAASFLGVLIVRLFAGVDQRLDRIDHRLDQIDAKLDRIESQVLRDHGERIARLEERAGAG